MSFVTPQRIVYEALVENLRGHTISTKKQIESLIKKLKNDINKDEVIKFVRNKGKMLTEKLITSIRIGTFAKEMCDDTAFTAAEKKLMLELSEHHALLSEFIDNSAQLITQMLSYIEQQLEILRFELKPPIDHTDTILQDDNDNDMDIASYFSASSKEKLINSLKLIAITSDNYKAMPDPDLTSFSQKQLFLIQNKLMSDLHHDAPTTKEYKDAIKMEWVKRFIISKSNCLEASKTWEGPSKSTLYRWYDYFKDKLMPRCLKMQDGSISEVLQHWAERFGYNRTPVIISIDAMSLMKHVRITADGRIIGLVKEERITQEQALLYRDDAFEYNDFLVDLNEKKKLIKAVFVILLVPLTEKLCPPIHLIFAAHGNATDDILTEIDKCKKEIIHSLNFSFYGVAMDGDRKYIKLHSDFGLKWTSLYTKHHSFSAFLNSIDKNDLVTCDPPHLMKRARYYITNNAFFKLGNRKSIYERNALKDSLLMIVNDMLWNRSEKTKMDDNYPREFFTMHALHHLLSQERWYGVTMMLPSTLLTAYFYLPINRELRIELICISLFFVMEILQIETARSTDSLYKMKMKTKKEKNEDEDEEDLIPTNQLIDIQWGREFMNSCVAILIVLTRNSKEYNTEHQGTYINEHFFSRCRRLSCNINTYEMFVKVFDKMVLATTMNGEIEAQRSHAKYKGATVESMAKNGEHATSTACFMPNMQTFQVYHQYALALVDRVTHLNKSPDSNTTAALDGFKVLIKSFLPLEEKMHIGHQVNAFAPNRSARPVGMLIDDA